MKNEAYERITDRITALLEQGTVPWHKPWKAKTGWPRNFISQKPYRGINVFLLLNMHYESPFWLTFLQASELGVTIRKGEKACPVVFWKSMKIEDKESGEEKKIPLLRIYHVFNANQCDGMKDAPPVTDTMVTVKPAEIVAGMPHPPVIKHGMNCAFYSPHDDCVGMPVKDRFENEDSYYATLFHELTHSTGHESRLHRASFNGHFGFGSESYSKEELIAEMGAAFLCGQADIVERTIDNSASYIQGWLEKLRSDKTLIVQAAAAAQKATDFILNRKFEDSEVAHD